MNSIKILFAMVMISTSSWAAGKMHYISTACSNGGPSNKGFQFGYIFFTSTKSGEIQFSWFSEDDQYSCKTTASVSFEDVFIHPIEAGCEYATFQIDLPELTKVSEDTFSQEPILVKYTYKATPSASVGYCPQGSNLIMTVDPLSVH